MLWCLEVIKIKPEEIIKVIEAVKTSDFSEVKIENGEIKLTLLREQNKPTITSAETEKNIDPQPPQETKTPEEVKDESDLVEVTAPMVGTFYRAPAPDAEPFVEKGDRVQTEDTLCILEAMKLMNEIKAEQAGIVEEILVENGTMVEYGQPLFKLKVES